MFFSNSKKLRISQSVLVALKAITQALEVMSGQEVVLDDIEFKLGKIVNEEGVGYRNIAAIGHSRYISPEGVSSPPFSFEINNISLIQKECWYIQSGIRATMDITDMVGYTFHSVYWDYPNPKTPFPNNAVIYIIHNNPNSHIRIVGTSRHDRHEEPVYTKQ